MQVVSKTLFCVLAREVFLLRPFSTTKELRRNGIVQEVRSKYSTNAFILPDKKQRKIEVLPQQAIKI